MAVPLISVVIPNYNYGRYLPQAIDSALAQSYPHLEVIVVDDGSTDDSAAVQRQYGERVRWLQQRHQGVSAARNWGIQESRGEVVAFLDADDIWHPAKLERQAALLRNPAVGLVYCGVQYITAAGQPLATNVAGQRGRVLQELALLRAPGVPVNGSTLLVRQACLQRTGGFDVALSTSADWDLCRRIACHYEIELVREPLVLYRLHAAAMHRNVDLLAHDMLHAFARMFADPAAAAVYALRRRCYGHLYLTLSGSYLHAGRWDKCLKYAVWSVLTWPPALAYVAALPMRRVRRRRNARRANSETRCGLQPI